MSFILGEGRGRIELFAIISNFDEVEKLSDRTNRRNNQNWLEYCCKKYGSISAAREDRISV